jgi:hypothetical protein
MVESFRSVRKFLAHSLLNQRKKAHLTTKHVEGREEFANELLHSTFYYGCEFS